MNRRVTTAVVGGVLVVIALTGCGSSGSTAAKPITVHVVAPADGSTTTANRVTVRGTVTPSNASIQVVGQEAQVGEGVFEASVPLQMGSNSIDILASAPG